MRILPRRPFELILCSLVLVSFLLLIQFPSPAWGDVGVQPILPGGSSISPENRTPIQMAAETVVIDVRLATAADNAAIKLNPDAYGYPSQLAWYTAVAEVNADFKMVNPTNQTISLTAWFPLASTLETPGWEQMNQEEIVPRLESFMVAVDGNPLDYTVTELPNPNGTDKPPLPWASFPVTFQADGETMIQVSYVLPLAQPVKSNALVLYYVFQTGAGWAGPIGQAELILNLPYPASTGTLSGMPSGSVNPPYFIYSGGEVAGIPPGAVLEGSQARWVWHDWEPGPNDDIAMLLMHPQVWDGLQADLSAVANTPGDGQAWWQLCKTYYALTRTYPAAIHPAYSQTYQPLGVDACRVSAPLLPGDAAPHYVLAWFYLSELANNPSLDALQPVLFELKLAQALEAVRSPSEVVLCPLPWDLINSECIETNVANLFPGTPDPDWYAGIMGEVANRAGEQFGYLTATAELAKTFAAEATRLALPTSTVSPTLEPTRTRTPVPSSTSNPSPTATVLATVPAAGIGAGQGVIFGVAIVVIVLVIVVYKLRRRLQSRAGK